ncbi:MAG: cupin domain-containing protein [Steroidobacteraceae bacterium]
MDEFNCGRLVVTGHAPDGAAIIVSDAPVPEIDLVGKAVRARFLWARDDVATFPDAGSMPRDVGRVPAPGGCRFSTLTVAAGATDDYHAFVTHVLGDLAEPGHPGFHRTPTLDFIVVLNGELALEVDRGEERVLRKGDSAVLNGVRHRWHNRGAADATLVAVMIGARVLNGEYS